MLEYGADEAGHDFIHANWVKGDPLFSRYILTQSPINNTIGNVLGQLYYII